MFGWGLDVNVGRELLTFLTNVIWISLWRASLDTRRKIYNGSKDIGLECLDGYDDRSFIGSHSSIAYIQRGFRIVSNKLSFFSVESLMTCLKVVIAVVVSVEFESFRLYRNLPSYCISRSWQKWKQEHDFR